MSVRRRSSRAALRKLKMRPFMRALVILITAATAPGPTGYPGKAARNSMSLKMTFLRSRTAV